MSEAMKILHCIGDEGGCTLPDIASRCLVPLSAIQGWIELLCRTGYLHRITEKEHLCPRTGRPCMGCSYKESAFQVRYELTEQGMMQNKSKKGR